MYDGQLLSLQRGLDEALVAIANTNNAASSPASFLVDNAPALKSASVDIIMKDWPTVAPKSVPDTLVTSLGSMFFFCAVMVVFIAVLQNIVTEKELKLRHAMEMMGLKPIMYWITMFLNQAILVAAAALVTVVMGLIFRFTVFTKANFGVMFFLFFLYGLSMVSFACT
jgi:hypothetical protein